MQAVRHHIRCQQALVRAAKDTSPNTQEHVTYTPTQYHNPPGVNVAGRNPVPQVLREPNSAYAHVCARLPTLSSDTRLASLNQMCTPRTLACAPTEYTA